jgi:hypothetical protein
MKTRGLRIAILIFSMALVTSSLFQNCAPVSFQSIEAASTLAAQSNEEPVACEVSGTCSPPPVLVETFPIAATKTTKPMDMIWIVDNSGSMAEEAASVRLNFSNFISAVDTTSDMKLLLLSQKETSGYAVSLPSGLDTTRFLQENRTVGSNNGPNLLIDLLTTYIADGKPFFRPDSKKIIVFVTDDDSAMTADNFATGLAKVGVSAGQASIFGFIGLGADVSRCQARTGTVYQSLAAQSGGNVYNICDKDWTQNFSALKTDILTKLGRTFTMKDPMVAKIVTVEVDGAAVDASMYSFLSGVLTVGEQVTMTEQSSVKIFYTQE